MMEALLAGDGDIATAYYDALLPLAAQGQDVVAFLALAKRPGSVLAASPAAGFTSIEQLRGATIGIPGPGSSSHLMLNAILRKHSIDPAAIRTAAVGVSAGAVAAMEQGKVDAAMLTNLGLSTLRLKHPALRVLADLRTPEGASEYLGSANYPSLCLAARRAWLEAHGDTAAPFAQAFLQANRWMAGHTAAQIRDALPPQARAADAQADVEAIDGMKPTLDTEGVLSIDGAKAVWAVTRASVPSLRDAHVDVARTIATLEKPHV
jgi:NitT/TauT family transport system substrate-binding protein